MDQMDLTWPESPMRLLDLERLPCGIFHCPTEVVGDEFPEFAEILGPLPCEGVLDVKVHMLMPGQYPCIPNWHYDFVPRDDAGQKLMHARDPDQKMYLWVSGPPFPEFRDGREILPFKWVEFTQFDEHRGLPSEHFGWRVFARVVPRSLCPPAPRHAWPRRHSQVYLDARGFDW